MSDHDQPVAGNLLDRQIHGSRTESPLGWGHH
jgi:hypothetical protein